MISIKKQKKNEIGSSELVPQEISIFFSYFLLLLPADFFFFPLRDTSHSLLAAEDY